MSKDWENRENALAGGMIQAGSFRYLKGMGEREPSKSGRLSPNDTGLAEQN